MMREQTADGQPIEFVRMTSHAHHTFEEFGLHNPELGELGQKPYERIFRRDCLEIDVKIGGIPLTIYIVHQKSMGSPRKGISGRDLTMPLRIAEASAMRRIIEDRFGKDHASNKRWVICGDFNDYYERLVITGDQFSGYAFEPFVESQSSLNVLLRDGFAENLVARRPEIDRWTLFHSRGPEERHLCQLDYILASPLLARQNSNAIPEIIRNGQPYRTPFPPGQDVNRYPRIGWDRPKASDHCPVAVRLDILS